MSAFLGPIHYWVFNKIKFQNDIVTKLISFADEKNLNIKTILGEKYGELDTDNLENIIDTSNIHGWLAERVSLVEYRLAEAVKIILDNKIITEDELKKLFFQMGDNAKTKSTQTAADAYSQLNDLLLDGMPCDRVNAVIAESEEQVDWRKNVCVHSSYWNKAGIDISIYNSLRESLIAGLLNGSEYIFVKDGEIYSIKRR